MAWRDTLMSLREELAEARAERQRQAAEEEAEERRQQEELVRLDESLGTADLLRELNSVLLDNKGTLEVVRSWEEAEETEEGGPEILGLDDLQDEEEDADVVSSMLSWEEGGIREIAVDLGVAEEGPYLHVNAVEVRPEREALEQALVQAFREELEL